MTEMASPHAQTALVTGASSGIGCALAHELARAGHGLVLHGRDREALSSLARQLREAHAITIDIVTGDLSLEGGTAALIAQVSALDRPIGLLINNAGATLHGSLAELPLEDALRLVELQIGSVLTLTQWALGPMLQRGHGRIMNVASVYSFIPVPFQTVYGASKAFMYSYSAGLAEELRGSGVSVTLLAPGSTRTALRERAGLAARSDSRGMDPAEVARAGYAGMMRGETLVIPGGMNRFFIACLRLVPHRLAARLMLRVNGLRGLSGRAGRS